MLLWRSSLLLEYSNRFIIFLWVLFYSSYIHIIHSRVRVEFLHIFPFVCSFPKLKTIQWTIKEGVAVIWKETVSGYISFVWTSRNKITFCSLLYLVWLYLFFLHFRYQDIIKFYKFHYITNKFTPFNELNLILYF